MSPTERNVEAYECSSCSRVRFHDEMECCDAPIESVETTVRIEAPETLQIAREVFGITPTELAVCHSLMGEGEATVDDISGQFDYDRSTVIRHLNHLLELGMIRKRSEVIEGGGRVNVYSSRSPAAIRRQFTLGLYVWLEEVSELADDLTDEKIEALTERAAEEVTDGRESTGDEGSSSVIGHLLERDWSP